MAGRCSVFSSSPTGVLFDLICHWGTESQRNAIPKGTTRKVIDLRGLWGNIEPRKKNLFFLKTGGQIGGKWQVPWLRCGTHLNSLNEGLLGQSRQSVVSHASPLLFSQVKSVWWLLHFLSLQWWTAWMEPGVITARHSIGRPVRWLERQGQSHDQRGTLCLIGKCNTLNGRFWRNPYV